MKFKDISSGQSFFCDALRYAGALLVLLSHAISFQYGAWYAPLSKYFHGNLGSLGLSVFFLLSGYLIAYTVRRKFENDPGYSLEIYLVERTTRIYIVFLPGAIVAALLCAVRLLVGDRELENFTLAHFAGTLAMLSGIAPLFKHGETFTLYAPSWSLNYEYFFYLLFGILAIGRSSRRGVSPLAWFALFVAVSWMISRLEMTRLLGYNWLLGVLVFNLTQLRDARTRRFWYLSLAGVVGALLTRLWMTREAPHPIDPWLVITAMAAMFYCSLRLFENLDPAPAVQRVAGSLAGFSYSLYLLHFGIISTFNVVAFVAGAYRPEIDGMRKAGVFVASILFAHLASWLFSLATERHTNRVRAWIEQRLGLRPARAQ